jgi:hypothetical protein
MRTRHWPVARIGLRNHGFRGRVLLDPQTTIVNSEIIMKQILASLIAMAFMAFVTTSVRAADVMTIHGQALCTKCELHETGKCATAIRTKDGTLYYAADNDVAKEFHKNICQAPSKVVATGTVKDKDGKKTILLTKIEAE